MSNPRKIVLIAGKKSHGPGAHDYERTMRLFKKMLDNSNVADRVVVEVHENGWPEDESTLETADTIVFNTDGRDGAKYVDVPFVLPDRMALIQKQIKRGCGFMTMHFSTFVTRKEGETVLEWAGGFYDWEGDDPAAPKWYSQISQGRDLELASAHHPVTRGVAQKIALCDEVYWKIRFRPDERRVTPIWNATGLKHGSEQERVVAWSTERADGGRGFATTVGHAYRLWQDENIRRLFLNAIVWTAKVEVPNGGVTARFYTDEQVNGVPATRPTEPKDDAMRVLIVSGNAAHKWHNWEKTTPAIQAALEADPRIKTDVVYDINELAVRNLSQYHAIALNYCNWHDPVGICAASREALVEFLDAGRGLLVLHFANGAFHFSLPEAAESDWPEYRKIVRRVWNHHGTGPAKSSHDAFGTFRVEMTNIAHPTTEGLAAFDVADELYFNADGDEPIEPLMTAVSKVSGKAEPMAWAYTYRNARVYQTLLGHSEKTYEAFEPCEMLRRAAAWVARQPVLSNTAGSRS
jgi:type 1 glutamine amidotransferase